MDVSCPLKVVSKELPRLRDSKICVFYWPPAAFIAGTEVATESGSLKSAVPLVKSKRCMVTLQTAYRIQAQARLPDWPVLATASP
jgi:hypothetical protein